MPEVRSAAADRIILKGEATLGTVWVLADTSLPIPFHFTPPEESLMSARERVAQADAEAFGRTAQSFAHQALHVEGVMNVVADSASQVVYAMVRDLDLQRDLRLHAMFREACQRASVDLVVLVEGEDDWPSGEALA